MAGGIGLSAFPTTRALHADVLRQLQVDSDDPEVSERDWATNESVLGSLEELTAVEALLAEALEWLDVDRPDEPDASVYRRRDVVRGARRMVGG